MASLISAFLCSHSVHCLHFLYATRAFLCLRIISARIFSVSLVWHAGRPWQSWVWLQGSDRGEWSHTTGIPRRQRAWKVQRALMYPSRGGLGVSPSARSWMHMDFFGVIGPCWHWGPLPLTGFL